jgi:D-glycero-D-manno-heptose 1,7-bisphosphate phosphatase
VTGLIFFEGHSVGRDFGSHGDLVKQLVASCLERDEIQVLVTSQYFRDSGTPERLESLVKDFSSGVMTRRGSPNRPGIFLDRDGTLIPDAGTGRKSLAEGDLQQNVVAAIAKVNELGIPIFLVTNQPGLAKGQLQVEDVDRVHEQINFRLAQGGAYLDDLAYCPHHPEVGFPGEVRALKMRCLCRKPQVGMVRQIAENHLLDLSASIMIGDSDADQLMAQKAGMHFIAASVSTSLNQTTTEDALMIAIRKILA